MKRIAALTSGGDSPGMNACLVALARYGAQLGVEILGARSGFAGLAEGRLEPLSAFDDGTLAARSGTVLGTSRDRSFASEEGVERLGRVVDEHGLEGLLVLGGDGSFRHGMPLAGQAGLAAIGIPSTIDNDVWGTDWTLGFDSACNLTLTLLDGLNATGSSLGERIFALETLGGHTGHIALRVAEVGQADYVLVPEVEPDLPHATEALKRALAERGWAVLVFGEGVPEARTVAEKLSEAAGCRLRYSATGHAARGAPVFQMDRWLARLWAERALDLLLEGQYGLVLGYTDRLVELPLAEVAAQRKQLDMTLYERINTRWGGSI